MRILCALLLSVFGAWQATRPAPMVEPTVTHHKETQTQEYESRGSVVSRRIRRTLGCYGKWIPWVEFVVNVG